MCIRDSQHGHEVLAVEILRRVQAAEGGEGGVDVERLGEGLACLLYTSDAADERSSVDLGGRRIIQKKKKKQPCIPSQQLRGQRIDQSMQRLSFGILLCLMPVATRHPPCIYTCLTYTSERDD